LIFLRRLFGALDGATFVGGDIESFANDDGRPRRRDKVRVAAEVPMGTTSSGDGATINLVSPRRWPWPLPGVTWPLPWPLLWPTSSLSHTPAACPLGPPPDVHGGGRRQKGASTGRSSSMILGSRRKKISLTYGSDTVGVYRRLRSHVTAASHSDTPKTKCISHHRPRTLPVDGMLLLSKGGRGESVPHRAWHSLRHTRANMCINNCRLLIRNAAKP
jgi:hypothetical protein